MLSKNLVINFPFLAKALRQIKDQGSLDITPSIDVGLKTDREVLRFTVNITSKIYYRL